MNIELRHKQLSTTNPAKVALQLYCDDVPIGVENIDLSCAEKRQRFVESAIKALPGIDGIELSEKLIVLTASLLNEEVVGKDELIEPLAISKRILDETESARIDIAKKVLMRPDLMDRILQYIGAVGVVNERPLTLALYLTFTSRLLTKPLAAIVLGSSSSGKSFAIERVATLFPDEAVLRAHRITPQALQYLPEGSLMHRAVVAGERSRRKDDDQAEKTRSLREMISDGVLRIAVTQKDGKGNLVTNHLVSPGPISYCESTTMGASDVFCEDRTRYLFLCCDESESQSKAVLTRMAADSMTPERVERVEDLAELNHTMQRLLQPVDVVVPFADEIARAIPARRPESRRCFGHLLGLVKATALLYQFQRQKDSEGRVIASVDDYQLVRTYLADAIGRGLGTMLTAGASALLEVIEDNYHFGDTFTSSDVRALAELGKQTCYDRLRELRDHTYLKISESASGQHAAKYELNPLPGGSVGLELPDLGKNTLIVSGGNADTNT